MTTQKRRIDRILEDGYFGDLPQRGTDDVRGMRAECSEEEALLSYERRLLHARLAILRDELDARAKGTTASILDRLPAILAEEQSQVPSRGAFPANEPLITFDQPSRRVSKLVSDDTLANLRSLDEAEIRRHIAELEDVESEVSSTRRAVIEVLNALNREIARRYQTGEADPSDVLTGN